MVDLTRLPVSAVSRGTISLETDWDTRSKKRNSNSNLPVSGPAAATRRAADAGPEIEGLLLDSIHFLYRKSVSNEIVLRESKCYNMSKQMLMPAPKSRKELSHVDVSVDSPKVDGSGTGRVVGN